MRTAAILPVKRFAMAKQRLGASAPGVPRMELVRAMVSDVLAALDQVPGIDLLVVVTGERTVAAQARRRGALLVTDGQDQGQSAAARLGVVRALREGAERVLLVPGDCPALEPAELGALLEHARGAREVVIVPDRHGTGTNALVLTPPDVIVPSFGPDSCRRHQALARAAGAACQLQQLPSLQLDVDTAEDLAALRAELSAGRYPAPSTRARLEEMAAAASVA